MNGAAPGHGGGFRLLRHETAGRSARQELPKVGVPVEMVAQEPMKERLRQAGGRMGWTYKGQSLCVSGATSGATCGHVVDGKYTEICGEDIYGNNECYDDMISAKRPLGSTAGGDSGAPVFELTGDSSVARAMGSHTGSIRTTSIFGSKSEWTIFQDFGTATRDFPGLEPYLGFDKDPV
ncbi:hypothetical protein [Microbispora sp. GKU 823]|uniref:hypothetical protein n=1 Tax=Microbispora sp. GKU 823 TaxID=1652100 RepID=UPI0009A44C5A|nr:hypothetical protein [Microbispora sp. GKU 823]OPG01564.1 hypothetical protein B1L11_44275 [Microbispora sp. GKU 823]